MIKKIISGVVRSTTNFWMPYSRLILISDGAPWVLSGEMKELAGISHNLGIHLANPQLVKAIQKQSVFYASQFILNTDLWRNNTHRLGLAYFHGRPGSGFPELDHIYEKFKRSHPYIDRIQVSHKEMFDIVLNTGISPEKVFLIPIGINLNFFSRQTLDKKQKAKKKFNIPESAIVVGSFQKDGAGWGEGREPKLIKGPDIFLKVMSICKQQIPELFVFLSGPARGYIKAGLEMIGIPYRHVYLKKYSSIGDLYQTLDLYLVTSRQEGGPKMVLEAMASGIPLVTTRVGQAMDLVVHGRNGWVTEINDVEGLAHWVEYIIHNQNNLENVLFEGLQTAENNSYNAQLPLWKSFMKGFVKLPD